jgi:hypothetical protein
MTSFPGRLEFLFSLLGLLLRTGLRETVAIAQLKPRKENPMPAKFRLAALAAAAFAAPLVSAPAQAALPPWYQRAAELRTVVAHPGLVDAFGTVPIERVEYAGPDLYRVSAGRCHVDARIVDIPLRPGMVGARQFTVRLGRRVCR